MEQHVYQIVVMGFDKMLKGVMMGTIIMGMVVQVTVQLNKTLYASRVLWLLVLQQPLIYVDVILCLLVHHGLIFGARSPFSLLQ